MKGSKLPLILLALLLGFGSGYCLRDRKAASSEEQTDHSPGLDSSERPRRKISKPSPVAAELESSLGLAKAQEFWLHWISGVEGAGLDDFPEMAKLAAGNPTALQILALRWLEHDPAHLFETLRLNTSLTLESPDRFDEETSRELYRLLFQEWPKVDHVAAARAISGGAKIPDITRMRMDFLESLMKIDPLVALETMKKWGKIFYGPRPESITAWVEANPRTALRAIMANDVGHVSHRLLEVAAGVWAKSDPGAAMELARSTQGQHGRILRKGAFKQWLENDLESAADWLADQESLQVQDELRPAVIKQWAGQDPEGALQWTKENLEGRHQSRAMSELIGTVMGKDQDLALKIFEDIAPGVARNEAAAVIAKELFPPVYTGRKSDKVDERTIAWFASLEIGARNHALGYVMFQWASTSPESFKSYLLSESGSSIPESKLKYSAMALARNDPAAMMTWAENFSPQKKEAIEGSVLKVWAGIRPQEASEWLAQIPGSDERRLPMVEAYLGSFLSLSDSQAAKGLRALPKKDWSVLEQTRLSPERIQRIKDLAGR